MERRHPEQAAFTRDDPPPPSDDLFPPEEGMPAPTLDYGTGQAPRRQGWFGRTFGKQSGTQAARPKKVPRRVSKRTSLAPAGSMLWGVGSMGATRAGELPLARVLSIQAPVAGEVLDAALKGSPVDRVVQPLLGGVDRYADVGTLLALPLLTMVHSRRPSPATEGALRMLVTQNLGLLAKGVKAARKREAELAEAVADLHAELDWDLGDDPVSAILSMIFQPAEPAPSPE